MHLGILFGFTRFHTKVGSLWNNMGTLCIDSDSSRWIKLGDNTLGG